MDKKIQLDIEKTWWWNDDVSNTVSDKLKLKEWRYGNTIKEKYIEVNKRARRNV